MRDIVIAIDTNCIEDIKYDRLSMLKSQMCYLILYSLLAPPTSSNLCIIFHCVRILLG